MRRGWVGIAVCVGVAAMLLSPLRSAAQSTLLDFEDHPANTSVTTFYAGRGVTFNSPRLVTDSTLASSGTDYIETCWSQEFCRTPVTMSFSSGQYRVAIRVGATFGPSSAMTVVLTGFNSAGAVVASNTTTLGPSRGPIKIGAIVQIVAGSNSIVRADVGFTDYNNGFIADDLEFERGAAGASVTPNPVDFGAVQIGAPAARRTGTVTSTGQFNLAIRSVAISGTNAGDFTVVRDGCSGRSLPAKTSCTVDVDFNPGAVGSRTATITFTNNTPAGSHTARLVGEGTTRPVVTTSTTTTIATTTTRPATTPTVPTTTTSTTIPIPPPTPGVSLVVEPALGPPGFVALARGTGWAPGPVQIVWSRGVGTFTATAGPDGSFVQQVLVFPRDVIGPRSLLATNGAQSAAAQFLVVPQTVQPAGRDVTTINRIRRFLQRSG